MSAYIDLSCLDLNITHYILSYVHFMTEQTNRHANIISRHVIGKILQRFEA